MCYGNNIMLGFAHNIIWMGRIMYFNFIDDDQIRFNKSDIVIMA